MRYGRKSKWMIVLLCMIFAFVALGMYGYVLALREVKAEMAESEIKSTAVMRHLRELNKLLYPKKPAEGE